jgi:steroid 5-alpha reductase family enzyme
LSPHLQSLNVLQLLNLTLIFAAASAVAHQLVWLLLERPHMNIWVDIWPMFVGNALGALMMLYGFKFVLDRVSQQKSQQTH